MSKFDVRSMNEGAMLSHVQDEKFENFNSQVKYNIALLTKNLRKLKREHEEYSKKLNAYLKDVKAVKTIDDIDQFEHPCQLPNGLVDYDR